MPRLSGSFVVRCWRVGKSEQRTEIEHIQSGNRVVVASLEEAVALMREQAESRGDGSSSSDHPEARTIDLPVYGARQDRSGETAKLGAKIG